MNGQEAYYRRETSANSYNQFAAVKDASGTFLKFEAPLQVNFAVPNESKYGSYAQPAELKNPSDPSSPFDSPGSLW